jgi:hypothetical protein
VHVEKFFARNLVPPVAIGGETDMARVARFGRA